MILNMNKFWKVLVIALVITSTTFAQQRGQGGRSRGGGRTHGTGQEQGQPSIPTSDEIKTLVSDLSKELLLSEEQEEHVLDLYTKYFEEVKEKTSSGRPDRDEMKELREGLENDIKELLTDNQKKLYTTYLKNNSPKKKRGKE